MKSVFHKTIALIVILSQFTLFANKTYAIAPLSSPCDTISTLSLGVYAEHSITFGMPVGDYIPIRPTDYILILMTSFTDVTEPTYISGSYTGTPTWSVAGTTVRITGISVALGKSITINGIAAFNPDASNASFAVKILVSSDVDGFNVRNEAEVNGIKTDGMVVMSALLEGQICSLRVSGFGSPGMFITFTEGGNTIGSTVATPTGSFSQNFPGLSPGEHTFLLYGIDVNNLVTPTVVIKDVLLAPHVLVIVQNVLMPPTLAIDKDAIQRGQTINISGMGTPNHTALLFTEPPLNSFDTIVDASGNFNYLFSDTSSLEYGDHDIFSILQNSTGSQSHQSQMLFFRVNSGGNEPPPGGTSCDVTRGNLNCETDNVVNLVDFSILLYYWGSNSAVADINKDGNVNLIDFSIMMYYWQG